MPVATSIDKRPAVVYGLLSNRVNRHGCITGATGTGKTVTLQVMAQGRSNIGVPVFMADVKGDLAGLSQAGALSPNMEERLKMRGGRGANMGRLPVTSWDVFGELGHPAREQLRPRPAAAGAHAEPERHPARRAAAGSQDRRRQRLAAARQQGPAHDAAARGRQRGRFPHQLRQHFGRQLGDVDKPKLVFFFDEARLLFDDAPKALLDKIEQVVRLIRSKSVGVFFVTQHSLDIPDTVLGQPGNRVQPALRAYTPRDQNAAKAAADTFRPNPALDTAQVITELGVGEALVSFLDDQGRPNIVERAFVRPPAARIGPVAPAERQALIAKSLVAGVYEQMIDRESAQELSGRTAASAKPASPPSAPAPAGSRPLPARGQRQLPRRHARRPVRRQRPARLADAGDGQVGRAQHRLASRARIPPACSAPS